MPILTFQNSSDGPLIDVLIGVSQFRANALRLVNMPIPPPIQLRFLIDTGASGTCVEAGLLKPLGLVSSGQIAVHTTSPGPIPAQWPQFDVSLTLLHPLYPYTIFTTPVAECLPLGGNVQGLLGRDILEHCLLIYNGQEKSFSLAF